MLSTEADLADLLRARLGQLMMPFGKKAAHLGPTAHDEVETTQDAILEVAHGLDQPGWAVYIVGGTLRELLVGANAHGDIQPRDVDIIVQGATSSRLSQCLEKSLVLERLTRFGGFHLSRSLPSGARVLFDIWRLEDTWGFHSQQIEPRIEQFPGTTFLNIDSCAMELLDTGLRKRRLFEKGFFAAIAGRRLDINYTPNPYPHVCAARSLLIAAQLDFTLSRQLAKFVLEHASSGVQAFIEAQRSHYGSVRAEAVELESWLHSTRIQFEAGSQAIHIAVSGARRVELGRY
jgi:hypothetical protein